MKPPSRTWTDARRLHAWRLTQEGGPQRQMAAALGVREAAASRWLQRARAGGPQALQPRPPSGAPRRVAPAPLARLPALLHRGPEAYGCRGRVWTRTWVGAGIRVAVGVMDHPPHVGRLLKALRWSPQQPVRRAPPRAAAAIARWRDETWPAITKGRRPSSRRCSS